MDYGTWEAALEDSIIDSLKYSYGGVVEACGPGVQIGPGFERIGDLVQAAFEG